MQFLRLFSGRIFLLILFITASVHVAFSQSTPQPEPIHHLYRVDLSTGEIVADTFAGPRLQAAAPIASRKVEGWRLAGVGRFGQRTGMVYSDSLTGGVAVLFYGGIGGAELMGSATLVSPGLGWTPAALADFNGDGHDDIVFVNQSTGEGDIYFYGGANGTTSLGHRTISLLSTTGWKVVGAADLNGDSHPDLILQNQKTGQVLAYYLGGAHGASVTASQALGTFSGWTASGMQDVNGDGHPDLILVNSSTGKGMVAYYGGADGSNPLGTSSLELPGGTQSAYIVPATSSTSTGTAPTGFAASNTSTLAVTSLTSSVPILLFNGTGTSSNDVTAVENVIKNAGYAYRTVNSSGLNSMTQAQLAAYKLFIVPGGNSITIGNNLNHNATTNVRNAVQQNGLHYLGICAGAFFAGYSMYNGLNLTSGVWFSKYPDSKTKDSLRISRAGLSSLYIYWQDGPQLSKWGKVVGKYPNGEPAIVEGNSGNGFVILSGVHPEAPLSWWSGLSYSASVDSDLAYATTLVKDALSGTVLPHY